MRLHRALIIVALSSTAVAHAAPWSQRRLEPDGYTVRDLVTLPDGAVGLTLWHLQGDPLVVRIDAAGQLVHATVSQVAWSLHALPDGRLFFIGGDPALAVVELAADGTNAIQRVLNGEASNSALAVPLPGGGAAVVTYEPCHPWGHVCVSNLIGMAANGVDGWWTGFSHDLVDDAVDNCPCDANPGQDDCDGNGVGDACPPLPESSGRGSSIPLRVMKSENWGYLLVTWEPVAVHIPWHLPGTLGALRLGRYDHRRPGGSTCGLGVPSADVWSEAVQSIHLLVAGRIGHREGSLGQSPFGLERRSGSRAARSARQR